MQKITDIGGGWGAFNVAFSNFGHIPSTSYKVKLTVDRFLYNAKHEIVMRRQSIVSGSGGQVAPEPADYGISFFLTTPPMSAYESSLIENGSESLLVRIVLTYDTGFGSTDTSSFVGCLDRHINPHWNSNCGGTGTSLDFDHATDVTGWKKIQYLESKQAPVVQAT